MYRAITSGTASPLNLIFVKRVFVAFPCPVFAGGDRKMARKASKRDRKRKRKKEKMEERKQTIKQSNQTKQSRQSCFMHSASCVILQLSQQGSESITSHYSDYGRLMACNSIDI